MNEIDGSSITVSDVEEKPEINKPQGRYFGVESLARISQQLYYDDYQTGIPLLHTEDSVYQGTTQDFINVANYPARIIEVVKDHVIVDLLIETTPVKIFQKRSFRERLLNGFDIKPGVLLMISLFEGNNEAKVKIQRGEQFRVTQKDFDLGPIAEKLSQLSIYKDLEGNF